MVYTPTGRREQPGKQNGFSRIWYGNCLCLAEMASISFTPTPQNRLAAKKPATKPPNDQKPGLFTPMAQSLTPGGFLERLKRSLHAFLTPLRLGRAIARQRLGLDFCIPESEQIHSWIFKDVGELPAGADSGEQERESRLPPVTQTALAPPMAVMTPRAKCPPITDEISLRRAMTRKTLSVGSRPVYNLHTGAVHAFEFFIQDTCHGQSCPLNIADLEDTCSTAFLYLLFSWYLEQGLSRFLETNASAAMPVRQVYFHTTESLFFHPQLIKAATTFSLDRHRLCLLLTEKSADNDFSRFCDRVRVLKSVGLGTGLENFTGSFVSMGKLALLPLHSLVVDCESSPLCSPDQFRPYGERLLKTASLLDIQVILANLRAADLPCLKSSRPGFYTQAHTRPQELAISDRMLREQIS